MLKMRLSMGGTKKRPVYKIVVADSRFPRDGRFIEKLGFFNPLIPKEKKERMGLDVERVKYWYEQERHHPLMFEKFEETVDYCDMYVKRLGKKIIHLFWLDDSFVVNMNGSINGTDNQIVVQRELKNFDELVVDEGYHFERAGNTEVAKLIKTAILRAY